MSLVIPIGHDTLGLRLPSSLRATYPKWNDAVGLGKGRVNLPL